MKYKILNDVTPEANVANAIVCADHLGRPARRVEFRFNDNGVNASNDIATIHINEYARVVTRNLEQCDTVEYVATGAEPGFNIGPDGELHYITAAQFGPITSVRISSVQGGAADVGAVILS